MLSSIVNINIIASFVMSGKQVARTGFLSYQTWPDFELHLSGHPIGDGLQRSGQRHGISGGAPVPRRCVLIIVDILPTLATFAYYMSTFYFLTCFNMFLT